MASVQTGAGGAKTEAARQAAEVIPSASAGEAGTGERSREPAGPDADAGLQLSASTGSRLAAGGDPGHSLQPAAATETT